MIVDRDNAERDVSLANAQRILKHCLDNVIRQPTGVGKSGCVQTIRDRHNHKMRCTYLARLFRDDQCPRLMGTNRNKLVAYVEQQGSQGLRSKASRQV